jgi:hypothetical protein
MERELAAKILGDTELTNMGESNPKKLKTVTKITQKMDADTAKHIRVSQ